MLLRAGGGGQTPFHGAYVHLNADITGNVWTPAGPNAPLTWNGVIEYDTDGILDPILKKTFIVPSGFTYASAGGLIDITPDPIWAAGTVYALNDIVQPTVGSLIRFRASIIAGTGTSGGAEPVWPTILGNTVVDNPGANQITWMAIHPESMKLRVEYNNEGFARGINTTSLTGFDSASTGHINTFSQTPFIAVNPGDVFSCTLLSSNNRKLTVVSAFSAFWIELRKK